MVVAALIILLSILILFGIREYYQLRLAIAKIPIRIHVNGSRGKSSVTRLISAGLRAGGIRTLAKTTGSAPRIIDTEGKDRVIHRLRSASIGEQVKFIRYSSDLEPEVIVIECMAVRPQYQWISEQKMIRSTIGVITNVRPDHLDEMGPTMDNIAQSIGNTIPFNGTLVTTESQYIRFFKDISKSRNSSVEIPKCNNISSEYINKLPYLEHEENVALALKVCELVRVNNKLAFSGMMKANPDPGALILWKLKFGKNQNSFINAFAANDPQSTLQIWRLVSRRVPKQPICLFLNTRIDRRFRTKQLLQLISDKIPTDILMIRGDNLPSLERIGLQDRRKIKIFPLATEPEEIIHNLQDLDHYLIFGIGNMVGWGEQFVKEMRKYRING